MPSIAKSAKVRKGIRPREVVAIQGEPGSFSHQAALQMLPGARILPCAVSLQVFEALQSRKVDCAVIPIENSLAGPVTEHYDLLLEFPTYIEREHNLRIGHNLIAAPGAPLKTIKVVFSHPVALAQCRKFFRQNRGIKAEPFYDTAGSVKHVMANHRSGAAPEFAAIASELAAKEYGGRILKRAIEDNKKNVTRFLLVRRAGKAPKRDPAADKATIAFALKNRPGTLHQALGVFASQRISLSKIESRPVPGKPWEYIFYVDLLSGDTPAYRAALKELRHAASFIKVLGIYRSR